MLTDSDPMPYGKYKGTKMANLKPEYLLFIYNEHERKPYNREVFSYIEDNLDVLEKEAKTNKQNKDNRNYNFKDYLDMNS